MPQTQTDLSVNLIKGEFWGNLCPVCFRPKDRSRSFCRGCYYQLPSDLRSGLWRKFGQGYEEVYSEARAWLMENAE
jgi:predicted amidophosphoribosyltransferase